MDDYACVESACEILAWFEGCLFCFKWEWTVVILYARERGKTGWGGVWRCDSDCEGDDGLGGVFAFGGEEER